MTDPDSRFPKIMDELPPLEISREFVLRCAETNAALEYWRSKCRGRAMPERADIDPVEMRAFLPNVGLIETPDGSAARPDYRIALAGSAIEAVLGPLTGRLLQEAVSPVIARRWRSVYEVVVREAVPIRAVSRVAFESKNFLMAEFVVMPLSRDARPVDMFLASLAFWSQNSAPE